MSRSPQRWSRSSIATGFIALALVASGAPAATSRVFVTSTTHTGDLKTEGAALCGGTCADGLAGGDAICNKRASDAMLGGTWVAWLSTSVEAAKARLTAGSGPFIRAAGTPAVPHIAVDIDDLTDGSLDAAIKNTEAGIPAPFRGVWTGTSANGAHAGPDCNAWQSAVFGGPEGNVGGEEAADSTWTDYAENNPENCSFEFRLYCFEVTPSVPPPPLVPVPAASAAGLAALLLLSLAGLAFLYRRQQAG